MKAYFDLESEPDVATGSEDSSPFSNSTIPQADVVQGVSSLFTTQELLGFLPSKQEVDRLVATWFTASEPMKLILHAPTFQREYQAFWQDAVGVSPAWLALLFAICGLGAEISGQLRRDTGSLLKAEDFRRLAAHVLLLSDYMSRPQPFVIETLLLQVKSHLLRHHDTTPPAWHLLGQAMRMMFLAGYHCDPGANTAISSFDCEMRRRVWMFAYEYDVLCSYQLGMVSFLNRGMCDTKPPSNLKDADFSPDHVPDDARSHEEYTPILMELYHIQFVEIYGEVVSLSHTVDHSAKPDLKTLHARLDKIHNSLPQVLKTVPISDCILDPPELILDRFRLESLYLKGLCVLHRPFVSQAGQNEGKQRCLDAALRLVECQIPVLEAAQPGGQLAPSAVFLCRHVHDFNVAAMLLCYEMKRASADFADSERSTAGGFEEKKVRETVLQACALYNVLGVTSAKARHALRAMQRFLLQSSSGTPNGATAASTASNTDASVASNPADFVGELADAEYPLPSSADFDYIPLNDLNVGFGDQLNFEQDTMFKDIFAAGAYGMPVPPQPILPTFKDPLT